MHPSQILRKIDRYPLLPLYYENYTMNTLCVFSVCQKTIKFYEMRDFG